MKWHNKMLGGILLVSGTTIGAGMLALPVATGMSGFIPSILLFVLYWMFMTFTAFLMLEVNLWMGSDTNLISMAQRTLGKWGAGFSWIVYLFLLYALTTAYIAGSGPIVVDVVKSLTGYELPEWAGAIPLLVIFGFFVYKGTKAVDRVNQILMLGLAIAFVALIIFLTPYVKVDLLKYRDWNYLWVGVSVVATSFGFHIIIPSLTTYMERDIKKLKQVIFIGSLIPLVVYCFWIFLTLGIIPLKGEHGVVQGYQQGANGAHLLTAFLGHPAIAMIARFFSFFAIVTSFLGVSLSLSDFLADGLNIKKTRSGRLLLYFLTFLPPLLFTLMDPRAFLSALEYAGAFGVVILLGLLPALMAWSGRYYKGFTSSYRVPGGKIALILAMLISIGVVAIEIVIKLNGIHLLSNT